MRLRTVDYQHPHAVALRDAMVAEVSAIYGGPRDTTAGGDTDIAPESVVLTLVGYHDEEPVAEVVLRRLDGELEIKRMYVAPAARGTGAAGALIEAVEVQARQLGAPRLVLHTGDRQPAAVSTYRRHGYTPIPVYEPYVGMPGSLCFEKVL